MEGEGWPGQEVMSQLLLPPHQVFDTFPEHDLSGRKDFIKHTVKSVSSIFGLARGGC